MKRIAIISLSLLMTVSLFAKQYPDSVQHKSQAEPNIAYGWNFEFGGGIGVGSYLYTQLFDKFTPAHTVNKIAFPAWHGGIGINYYFVPWMGLGVGAQFSAYANRAAIEKPWTQNAADEYGDSYTMTATPDGLTENQNIYMLEIPVALKFRARPGVVGFTGTAGVKLGLPLMNNQKLSDGVMKNSVYYPFYDLTMSEVPTVVENLAISSEKNSLNNDRFRKFNFAAYLELGMLFRLHQRVDLAVAAYANYYFTDLLDRHGATDLAFADGRSAGKYPMPYSESYAGVLQTNEVKALHPWSAGIKIGLQINANRTKAQRDYDREQKRLANMPPQEPAPVIEPAPVVAPEPVVEPEPVNDREEAIERIRRIAAEHNIDICETFCPVQPEPAPVITDAVAAALDEELQKAVIWFEYDKAVPILEPADILERIAEVLRNHPDQKIHIHGHTCKIGKPEYNKKLAWRRANAVADILRSLGVHDDQLLIASLGAEVPFHYNKHPYAQDRRVEIVPTYRTTEVVRPGSRLAQIARRHYGQPEFWIFIYEANMDKIEEPQNLPIGIELVIPDLTERLGGMTEQQAADEAQQLKEQLLKK